MIILALFSLEHLNQHRLDINETAMLILRAWALGNIGRGLWAMRRATGTAVHFHRMNGFWNLVNLAITVSMYFTNKTTSLTLAQSLAEQYGLEKFLLLNVGLDAAYVMTGLWLREKAKTAEKRQEMLEGFGRSIIVQGAFLLVFDTCYYFVQHSITVKMLEL